MNPPMMIRPSHASAFALGFALAATTFHLLGYGPRARSRASSDRRGERSRNDDGKSSPEEDADADTDRGGGGGTAVGPRQPLMDSPDLPLRMIRKAEAAIRFRTTRILVVVELCTNDHNYSAILRTAEALGVQNLWIVSPPSVPSVSVGGRNREDECDGHGHDDDGRGENVGDGAEVETDGNTSSSRANRLDTLDGEGADGEGLVPLTLTQPSENGSSPGRRRLGRGVTEADVRERTSHHIFAQRATDWLTVREFDSTASCLRALRDDGRTVWATDLSQEADCLTREGLLGGNDGDCDGDVIPKRLAIVFGTEAVGCTAEMLSNADRRVYLPLRGFADSLNLSVAAALCLHQLFHLAPDAVGDATELERRELRTEWFARLAARRLQTKSEKKRRNRLVTNLKWADEMERQMDLGVELNEGQTAKLEKASRWRSELDEMERSLQARAELAVREFVEDPPEPLSDMRRADEHRVCYVGVGTKKKYSETWKDMPATANYEGVRMRTCREFRDRADAAMDPLGVNPTNNNP